MNVLNFLETLLSAVYLLSSVETVSAFSSVTTPQLESPWRTFDRITTTKTFSVSPPSSFVHRKKIIAQSTTSSSSSSSSTSEASYTLVPKSPPTPFQPPTRPASQYDAVIAGGGPAGLLTAIMLTRKYGPAYRVAVCERRPQLPPSPQESDAWGDVARFYLLGIGHRGQSALQKFGLLEEFINASVEVQGRRDWQPGQSKVNDGRTTIANKDPPSRVLARDKLVGLLHEHLVEQYIRKTNATVDLLYGYEVDPLSFGNREEDAVTVRITKCEELVTGEESSSSPMSFSASQDSQQVCNVDDYVEVTTNFLVGADGASRTVARAMETADTQRYNRLNFVQKLFAKRPFRITRFQDDNPRVYKSVPILLPPDWPRGLNYSARSRSSRITLEALPSDNQGNLCALLLMKPDDELAQPNVDPNKLRQFFDEEFSQFGALVNDEEMARVAQKPASPLPVFRYAGPRLCVGSRTLVLGDAAHTVKPYYGLGANTALEDVQVLSDILDESRKEGDPCPPASVVPRAVQTFSDRRSGDAEALVTISRNMDRPGKLFIVNFLLPIILDGIFHKVAPKIFGPNMFGMFQKKGIGFKQIQRKKRLDRAMQLTIMGTISSGLCVAVKGLVGMIAKATGKNQSVVSLGLAATLLLAAWIKKVITTKKTTET